MAPGKQFKRLLLLTLGAACAVAVIAWRVGSRMPGATRAQVADVAWDDASEGGIPAAWRPAVKSRRWQCIVIHHSASEIGGAERFDEYHKDRGFDELGYHFVVGNGSDTAPGKVEVGPRWVAQKHGAHCKTDDEYYNQHGIGICLVGNLQHHAPDPRQMRSLVKLVRFLCREYDIPPDRIYTHGQITGQTLCPGRYFDLNDLRRDVATAAPARRRGKEVASRG